MNAACFTGTTEFSPRIWFSRSPPLAGGWGVSASPFTALDGLTEFQNAFLPAALSLSKRGHGVTHRKQGHRR